MLYTSVLTLALAAYATAQSAVLSFTSVDNPITDGVANAITYQTNDTVTPVTIVLRKGLATNLLTLYNITTTANGGSYIWTPRTDLPNGNDYALQIIQGTQTNYFGPFRVQGYLGPLSTSSSAGSAASTGMPTASIMSSAASSGISMSRNATYSGGATLSATSTATVVASVTGTGATSRAAAASGVHAQIGGSLAMVGAIAAVLL